MSLNEGRVDPGETVRNWDFGPDQNLKANVAINPGMATQQNLVGTPPPRPPLKRIRPLSIVQLEHGYNVNVGCSTIAIENKARLVSLFARYLDDPEKTEKDFINGVLL